VVWDGRSFLWSVLRHRKAATLLAALLFAAPFVVFTAPQRLFLPEGITLGLATTDSYFDDAMAQMIAHYGAISNGGDGLAHHSYHFLSHVAVAGLSKISGASISLVYLYWGALTLKLQLVWSLFLAGLFFFQADKSGSQNAMIWRLAYAWVAAILVSGFESESFLLGAILFTASLPLVMVLATLDADTRPTPSLPLALAIAAIFLCTMAKLSAGFFGAIGLLVVAWHFRGRPGIALAIIVSLVVLTLFTYSWILPKDLALGGVPLSIKATDYYENYLNIETLMSYALPALVVFLLHARPQVNRVNENGVLMTLTRSFPSASEVSSGIRSRLSGAAHWLQRADGVSQFVTLSLLACVVILFTMPIGSNIAYFSMFLYVMALLLLPLALQVCNLHLPHRLVVWTLAIVLGFNLLSANVPFLMALGSTVTSLYRAASGYTEYRPGDSKASIMDSLKKDGRPFSGLHAMVEASPWAGLTRELQRQAQSANGRLAVQIPPSGDEVWHRLSKGSAWWCMAPQLMVPAETGLFGIRSMAPKAVESECAPPGILWYGFGGAQDLHRTANFSNQEICALAKPLNIGKVYRLSSYTDLSGNSVVSCE